MSQDRIDTEATLIPLGDAGVGTCEGDVCAVPDPEPDPAAESSES